MKAILDLADQQSSSRDGFMIDPMGYASNFCMVDARVTEIGFIRELSANNSVVMHKASKIVKKLHSFLSS